jgi:hypothetical protein
MNVSRLMMGRGLSSLSALAVAAVLTGSLAGCGLVKIRVNGENWGEKPPEETRLHVAGLGAATTVDGVEPVWLDVPLLELGKAPEGATVRCGETRMPEIPDAIVEIEREGETYWTMYAEASDVRMTIIEVRDGFVDNRVDGLSCRDSHSTGPGVYAVYFGYAADRKSTRASVLLTHERFEPDDQARRTTRVPFAPPEGLPVERRRVADWFPYVGHDNLRWQEVQSQIPRQLYVMPSRAIRIDECSVWIDALAPEGTIELLTCPGKHEALLLEGIKDGDAKVWTADGERVTIEDPSLLVPATRQMVFPKAVHVRRDFHIDRTVPGDPPYWAELLTDDDRFDIAQLAKEDDAAGDCARKYYDEKVGRGNTIKRIRTRNGVVVDVEDVGHQMWKKGERLCGQPEIDRELKRMSKVFTPFWQQYRLDAVMHVERALSGSASK